VRKLFAAPLQKERVHKEIPWDRNRKIDGQKIGRRSVQDRGAGLLDIQAMLANDSFRAAM